MKLKPCDLFDLIEENADYILGNMELSHEEASFIVRLQAAAGNFREAAAKIERDGYEKAVQIRRRQELTAMAHDMEKRGVVFFVPREVNFNDEYVSPTVPITIDTHLPTKWRFVDLETGHVWRWARPEERSFPGQTFKQDAFCEFTAPQRFWHARG